jgi:hypothetical protein
METPAATETPLVDYAPQPTAKTTPVEGEKKSGGISPGAMGLLGMGLNMMATPPRNVPYTTAEIIGRGGQAGIAYYEKALEDKRKQQALDVSAEEHKLTREDRRQGAIERADFYKERNRIMALEQLSKDEAREATAKENAVLDVPIDPAVAAHYKVNPKMTVRAFNKMQAGLTAMAKPEKPEKRDPWTDYVSSLGREPTTEEAKEWHRAQSAGGEDGPGKSAAITHINRELVSQYLDSARDNITSKSPAGSEKLKSMLDALNNQDPLTGGPSEAKVRESLSPEQRKEYDFVKVQAQKYSTKLVPAEAVAKAKMDWAEKNPPKKEAGGQGYVDYKRVYQSILDYKGWDNKTKHEKIKALNDKARANGVIE